MDSKWLAPFVALRFTTSIASLIVVVLCPVWRTPCLQFHMCLIIPLYLTFLLRKDYGKVWFHLSVWKWSLAWKLVSLKNNPLSVSICILMQSANGGSSAQFRRGFNAIVNYSRITTFLAYCYKYTDFFNSHRFLVFNSINFLQHNTNLE